MCISQMTDLHAQEFILFKIQKLVEKAGLEVILLINVCMIHHNIKEEVWDLIQCTGFSIYSVPMGKMAISEDYEHFGRVHHLDLLLSRLGTDVTNRFMLALFHTQILRKRSKMPNLFSPLVGLGQISTLAISPTICCE